MTAGLRVERHTKNVTLYDLESCRWKAVEVRRANDRVDELKAILEYTRSLPSNLPHVSGYIDKYANAMDELRELEEDAVKNALEYLELQSRIRGAIASITDAKRRLAMQMRYQDGYTETEIARRMHYQLRWIQQLLHEGRQALGIFADKEISAY